jgi:hypothetical protein
MELLSVSKILTWITLKMQIDLDVKTSGLLDKLSNPEFYPEAMKTGANNLRSWMATTYYPAKNASEPNKLGGARTNFWADIGRSIQTPFQRGLESILRILDPRIAQKVYGGIIKAKRVRYLTIPISKEAYSKRARVLERDLGQKLFVIKSAKGNRLLVSSVDGEIKPHYLLKEQVDQKPWPGALPPKEDMVEKFNEGIEEYIYTAANLA